MSIVRQGVDIYMVEAASEFGAAVVLDPDAVFSFHLDREKKKKQPRSKEEPSRDPEKSTRTLQEFRLFKNKDAHTKY